MSRPLLGNAGKVHRTDLSYYEDTLKINFGGTAEQCTQPRGTEAALPGCLGERRTSTILWDRTRRMSAGAHHFYERPQNGIPM